MKCHSYKSVSSVQLPSPELVAQASSPPSWSTGLEITSSKQSCLADTWVQLLELPSPFSHDEALLLCQHSEDKWVAWIPNHGEAILHANQFCLAN